MSVSIWIQTVKQDTSLSFAGTKASIHMNSSTPHKNPSLPAVCSNILSCQHDNSTEILFTVANLLTLESNASTLESSYYFCFKLIEKKNKRSTDK